MEELLVPFVCLFGFFFLFFIFYKYISLTRDFLNLLQKARILRSCEKSDDEKCEKSDNVKCENSSEESLNVEVCLYEDLFEFSWSFCNSMILSSQFRYKFNWRHNLFLLFVCFLTNISLYFML